MALDHFSAAKRKQFSRSNAVPMELGAGLFTLLFEPFAGVEVVDPADFAGVVAAEPLGES